jgi:hypothetical protein
VLLLGMKVQMFGTLWEILLNDSHIWNNGFTNKRASMGS